MNTIHKELIAVIKQRTEKGVNPVDLLTDIIPMSKEAAYRRLRGEIPFTLDEAVKICLKLNVSLDNLTSSELHDQASFRHTVPIHSENPLNEYLEILENIKTALIWIKDVPDAVSYTATSKLPTSFYFKYKQLSKFKLFKVIYQSLSNFTYQSFSNFNVPENIYEMQADCLNLENSIETYFLLDNSIIKSFINELTYFKELNYIATEEIKLFKDDLHALLDDMEATANSGKSKMGKNSYIYISPIYFDAAYSYIKGGNFQACSLGIYDVNYLSTLDVRSCAYQLRWIEVLIRRSTLISRSGEIQRKAFFKNQHLLVDAL